MDPKFKVSICSKNQVMISNTPIVKSTNQSRPVMRSQSVSLLMQNLLENLSVVSWEYISEGLGGIKVLLQDGLTSVSNIFSWRRTEGKNLYTALYYRYHTGWYIFFSNLTGCDKVSFHFLLNISVSILIFSHYQLVNWF